MGLLDFPVESSALGTMTDGLFKVQNLKYALGNADLQYSELCVWSSETCAGRIGGIVLVYLYGFDAEVVER